MDLREWLEKLRDEISRLWGPLDRRQKVMVVILGLATLVAMGGLLTWAQTPDYAIAFTGLKEEDAGAIVAKLKEGRIPYQIGADGATIQVPAQKVNEVRLEMARQGLSLRQQVTANNLANIDTPSFKASDVTFEAELKRALGRNREEVIPFARTHPAHLSLAESHIISDIVPRVKPQNTQTQRNDGNNMDIDQEMFRLVETNINYNAMVQLIAKKFSLLRSIISEGKR